MRARTRRKINMGIRVLEFGRLHPDPSPAYIAAMARLKERLTRAEQLARQEISGWSDVHAATGQKKKLRLLIRRSYLDHLVSVAEAASVEEPSLAIKFVYPKDATTYQAFYTAASGIAAEAETWKDLLLRHGLSEEVLSELNAALDEFQAAERQGDLGRLAHVGAGAELVVIARQVLQVVRVMNGVVRLRFKHQTELLAAWESASNVIAAPHSHEEEEPELSPAA
jgi:hypothetical protein